MSSIETKSVPRKGKTRISGRVFSKSGAVLNGAKVKCEDSKTSTLADGLYIFDELHAGTFKIEVNLKSFRSETKKISIKDGEEAVLDFYLDKAIGTASIKGHVYDSETRRPIVNKGSVLLILPISNRYAHIDADGYYEFSNLPAGTYNVSTSIPEHYDCDVTLTVTDGESKEHDFFCKIDKTVEPPWG